MLQSSGTYYDGRSSRGIPVRLQSQEDGLLALQGTGLERQDPLAELRLEQLPGQAQPRLHWPDGAMVELDDHRLDSLFAQRPTARLHGLLHWAERHPAGLPASVLLIAATLTGLVMLGLPLLGAGITAAIPRATERKLGDETLAELDTTLLQPSQLPPQTQARVRRLLAKVQPPPASERRLRLVLRHSPLLGANALCLPGGLLVVTDGLVRLASDDELLAVLAHEAGHDQRRHPLQMMVRGRALGLVTGLLGDGQDTLTGLSQTLVQNAYSRQFELEADRLALATLRRWNRPAAAFDALLDKLERQRGASKLPSLLLTHPSKRERQAQLQALDRAGRPSPAP
ncbi:MAG: M48 family metallopeptidase [Synechococcaceae cyanobacterium]|jgi:Zn-dependent protease with chaperone function